MNRRRFLKTAGATAAVSAVAPAAAAPDPSRDVCLMSGRELARLIRTRELSAREVMAAHLQRIARVNPRINAIVAKLDDDACLALADEADRRLAGGVAAGALHGLPIAFKDTEAAVGFPWTRGSPIFKNDMPKEDTVLVERLRKVGAIPSERRTCPSSRWARIPTTRSTARRSIPTT